MQTRLNGLHPTVAAYLVATNHNDPSTFLTCFTEDAVVDDVGRVWRGLDAIRAWSEREIFTPNVELEVLAIEVRGAETVVTTRVEGDFDRTGLPDPVVVEHRFALAGGRISRLTCRLAP
jgi:uncharacterized protein (TIGR02246 family)